MSRQNKKRLMMWSGIIFVLVAAVGVFAIAGTGAGESAGTGSTPTFAAEKGPLTISVTESGSIQSLEQVIITNQVEGRTEIIFIVDEGTVVKKGDLLVELDSSSLEDQKINQEISVQNAEAAFIRARENLAVAESQAKSDISQAELDNRFANEDKTKYIEGEFPKEKTELESKIKLAEEELKRAQEQLEGSARLLKEKYIAETEYQSDELAMKRAQLDYQLAQANLDLLNQYTYPRKLAELDSAIEQNALALDRVKRKASADVVQAQANLRAAEAEFNRQKTRLDRINDQIVKTKIYAPADGMVIYATSVNQRGRFDNSEPLQAGYEAREREELIYLPTADSLMAKVAIHESALEKVKVGQAVRITIPAVPGHVFNGVVKKIAPLPDQSNWWNPDLRVYSTEIHLSDKAPGVRSGMSCQAEIIVDEYHDAVYVPVQAVVRAGREASVYVQDAGGALVRRKVDIGLDNNKMVRIVSGLEPGERVSLTPPLDAPTSRAGRAMTPGGVPGAANAQPGATQGAQNGQGGQGTHRPQGQQGQRPGMPGGGATGGAQQGAGEHTGDSRPAGEGAGSPANGQHERPAGGERPQQPAGAQPSTTSSSG